MRRLRPDLALTGTGGAHLRAAWVELLTEHTGVVGFVEVIRHIPAHLRILRQVKARLA
ncbi:MAG: lipid-A-disaccharide synthase, partial [bacterium]